MKLEIFTTRALPARTHQQTKSPYFPPFLFRHSCDKAIASPYRRQKDACRALTCSRCDVCSCPADRQMLPGDSQEVNCRIAAREATLGCGPNGPRNDRKIEICTDHCVIARSEATWQSPGAMFVPAQQIDKCYQEIPTGLTALGMTEKSKYVPITVSLRGAKRRGNLPARCLFLPSRSINATRRFPRA